jgi:hypothetical protein
LPSAYFRNSGYEGGGTHQDGYGSWVWLTPRSQLVNVSQEDALMYVDSRCFGSNWAYNTTDQWEVDLRVHVYNSVGTRLAYIRFMKWNSNNGAHVYVYDSGGAQVFASGIANAFGHSGYLKVTKTGFTFTNPNGSQYHGDWSYDLFDFSTCTEIRVETGIWYGTSTDNRFGMAQAAFVSKGNVAVSTQVTEAGTDWSEWSSLVTAPEGSLDPLVYSVKAFANIGDKLVWNGTTWINEDNPEYLQADYKRLVGLLDTTIVSPTSGQSLVFDGAKWVNQTVAGVGGGGGGASALADLTDVVVTPQAADILSYNGAKWINKPLDYNDLVNKPIINPGSLDAMSDVEVPNPVLNDVLRFDGTRWIADAAPSTSYIRTFTNADLQGGVLPVVHNLSSQFNGIFIYDDNNRMVIPDDVFADGIHNCQIVLTTYGTINGNWTVKVIK